MDPKLFILSADDDCDDQDLLEEALRRSNPEILLTRVGDGNQLMDVLSQISATGHPHPDLILLDLNMPVVSGREALRILKSGTSLFRDVPVAVLTTSRAEEDMSYCRNNGADTYLVKPSSFPELTRIVAHAVDTLAKNRIKDPGKSLGI